MAAFRKSGRIPEVTVGFLLQSQEDGFLKDFWSLLDSEV